MHIDIQSANLELRKFNMALGLIGREQNLSLYITYQNVHEIESDSAARPPAG